MMLSPTTWKIASEEGKGNLEDDASGSKSRIKEGGGWIDDGEAEVE